jgi:hypothetical protein
MPGLENWSGNVEFFAGSTVQWREDRWAISFRRESRQEPLPQQMATRAAIIVRKPAPGSRNATVA